MTNPELIQLLADLCALPSENEGLEFKKAQQEDHRQQRLQI